MTVSVLGSVGVAEAVGEVMVVSVAVGGVGGAGVGDCERRRALCKVASICLRKS